MSSSIRLAMTSGAAGSRAGAGKIWRDLAADVLAADVLDLATDDLATDDLACLSGFPAILSPIGRAPLHPAQPSRPGKISDCDDNIANYIVNNIRSGYHPAQQTSSEAAEQSLRRVASGETA